MKAKRGRWLESTFIKTHTHTRRQRCNLCENEHGSLRISDRNIHHVSLTASLSIQPTFQLFYFKELLPLSHNAILS